MNASSTLGRNKTLVICFMSLGVIFLGWIAWHLWQTWARQSLQAELRTAFSSQRYPDVEKLAKRLVASGGLNDDFLWLAGQAASKDGRFKDAIAWFKLIPSNSPRTIEAIATVGEIYLLSLHQLSPAEVQLRRVLELAPEYVLARQQLAGLLGMTGRWEEAAEARIELIRQRRFTRTDLMLMGLRETALENADSLKEYERDAPNDPLTHLARGHFEFVNQNCATAESNLRKVIHEQPHMIKGHALLGRLLIETRRFAELGQWQQHLPTASTDDPEIWTVLGDWSREAGNNKSAIRCYLEAIRRDSLRQDACYRVAPLLTDAGHPALADRFRQRAATLQEQLVAVKRFHAEQDPATIRSVVERCEQLGMLWEAYAWCLVAGESPRNRVWATKARTRLEPALAKMKGRISSEVNLTADVLWESFPLPEFARASEIARKSKSAPTPPLTNSNGLKSTGGAEIAFRDAAQSVELSFQYVTGHDASYGPRVFEFAGGGVGVLDYDLDDWPDLHFTQGCTWPPTSNQTHRDRLFRNIEGQMARDVTDDSRLTEFGYSHGVAVGDWNNDGFPDLFIGNAGPNRLFLNLGDGTFHDVTESTGVAGDQWTTSCVIADLNGDSLPDLYAANYLAGENIYDRLCAGSSNRTRACTPHDLDAAPDEFYLNLGDGRFSNQTEERGFKSATGKSLGLVAADFEGSGGLSLFVANDTDGNQFFQNPGQSAGDRFEEQAIVSGLAFDHQGRSMACMGIAAGDANEDQKLDLFVTNYHKESNCLYLQQSSGGFQDRANEAGLRVPSIDVLGFGTQFLDADLDGRLDLVLVNGHVDDQQGPGIPYAMLPQFFWNAGSGQFIEQHSKTLGPWFGRPRVGRGLSTVDWNRDGLTDFTASQLEHSASLLINVTQQTGHRIVIRLIATSGNRDAIGAIVQLETASGILMRQLSAGDGYLASNERHLVFGLGVETKCNRLHIKWPGGVEQIVENLKSDFEYRIIERQSTLFSRSLSVP